MPCCKTAWPARSTDALSGQISRRSTTQENLARLSHGNPLDFLTAEPHDFAGAEMVPENHLLKKMTKGWWADKTDL
jgi:hypothetical protein